MAWREILTFADANEDGVVRASIAKELADAHDAHLEVDVVSVRPAQPYGPGADLVASIYAEAIAPVRKAAAQAAARLRAMWPANPEQISVEQRECFADELRALAARSGRTADLVVLPQPSSLDGSDLDTELFLGAVFGSGRPSLVLPRWIRPHAVGRRVLIAWKGAPEAARAVQGAMPLIRTAESVRICIANPRSVREGEDDASLERLATYLLRHGAKVEPVVKRSSWEGPEKMFLSEIEGFGADLLVMGGYSRPRLQEIIFGGMTAAMVRDARIPIVLAH